MHIITRFRAALRSFSVFTSGTHHQPNPSESAYTTQLGQGFSGTRVF
jgi:hypothetical protein